MCTRVVYSGTNGMVATGRSMDWKTDMHSNLWVFPRGMERNGETGENSLKWVSKYGSVVTSAFEIAFSSPVQKEIILWLLSLSCKGYLPVKRTSINPGQYAIRIRSTDIYLYLFLLSGRIFLQHPYSRCRKIQRLAEFNKIQ